MFLTRHRTANGPRWAADGRFLPEQFRLGLLLELPASKVLDCLKSMTTDEPAEGMLLPPIEATQEVWASGVTYLRSRDARKAESETKDVYERVYDAVRPELFFKSPGFRSVGHEMKIRLRKDSRWNVPEPELTLIINRSLEVIGFTVGNDVSSRDIEGENPLYLPQAKLYDGSCAIGPGIQLADIAELADVPITLSVERKGARVFHGETRSSQMKRGLGELVGYLGSELAFPEGVFLMTGTGIVPGDDFTLEAADRVRIVVASLTLENEVE